MSRWRLSDWILGLLAWLVLLAIWEAFLITNRPQTRGCGGNFTQYYTAGTIVRGGDIPRLYDQAYFRRLQEPLRDDPLPSIYPPSVGMLVAPLTRLSYANALVVWWVIQALCIFATGAIFYRNMRAESRMSNVGYRSGVALRPSSFGVWHCLLALAALLPLWIALGIGQLTPIFLLALAGGLALHKRGQEMSNVECRMSKELRRPPFGIRHSSFVIFASGLLLSLLALKPQLAAGLVLWMLLRRDYRTLLGLAAGFTVQAAAVATELGPGVWLDYFHALPAISAMTRSTHFSPMVEASFVGIASNLVSAAGHVAWESAAMKLAYAVTVSFAVIMLCRVVWSRRMSNVECRMTNPVRHSTFDIRHSSLKCEYACGVLFMTIVPPYLIVYDQSLIAVALAMLWSSPRWRWGIALWAAMTAVAANLSLALGFNFTGLVALATMYALSRAPSTSLAPADRPAASCQCSLTS